MSGIFSPPLAGGVGAANTAVADWIGIFSPPLAGGVGGGVAAARFCVWVSLCVQWFGIVPLPPSPRPLP